MSSQVQIKANRKNALKSTGPRTAEGKEASSQNALKHGLCAKKSVIKTENQEEFEIFRDNMIADLSPDGAMEEMLAERIVSLSWRLKRAEHFQNAVVDSLIEYGLNGYISSWNDDGTRRAQKEAENGNMDIILGIVINKDFANARTLEQLLIYERRIESSLYRTIAELKKMRQAKKTEYRTQKTEVRDSSGDGWHPQAQLGDGLDLKETCTNEPNSLMQEETAWAEAHPTSVRDSSSENEKQISDTKRSEESVVEIRDCTNEANSPMIETVWAEVHPTSARDSSGESELHISTNKANVEDESNESHPHHEDFVMMEMTPIAKGE